jgi:hypothetical protein
MFPHSDSVIAFGLMRHQELQAENLQVCRAMAAVLSRPAQSATPRQTRNWMRSILIRMGTALQAEENSSRCRSSTPLMVWRLGIAKRRSPHLEACGQAELNDGASVPRGLAWHEPGGSAP